jgi:hypothetical protein
LTLDDDVDVEPTVDVERRPTLCPAPRRSATTGRSRSMVGQTSAYRFAAVKVNARLQVDVIVEPTVDAERRSAMADGVASPIAT